MTELPGRPDRIDASPDQVARERWRKSWNPSFGTSSRFRPAARAALSRPRFATLFRLSGFPLDVVNT
jgi:hypothetical protein